MRYLLPLFLACVLLLAGCQTAGGFLTMPDSPSADLPDRPGVVSDDSSEAYTKEESEQSAAEHPERNMSFLETDTPYLFSILTREGDQKVLGMTYGDGTYFALTQREKGIALTGYDTEGTGTFAGILEESFTFPVLMGYADGYACLYSAEANRTFACKADSTYVWYNRGENDSVQLYRGGYAIVKDGIVSFYGPQHQKAYTSYAVPDGMTFLLGNEECALMSKQDGTLVQLTFDADTVTETPLSPYLSYDGKATAVSALGQSVVLNPYDRTLLPVSEHTKVLALGDGYLIIEENGHFQFTDTNNKTAFSMPASGTFRFGARTDDGFLFAVDNTWYLLKNEALNSRIHVSSLEEGADLLTAAYQALCGSTTGQLRLFDGEFPTDGGFSATQTANKEALFASAAFAQTAAAKCSLSERVDLYLCDSVTAGTVSVPYAMLETDGVTTVLLDVTDPYYQAQLTEIFTMLQEGIQG